jgi:hypothetical protein
MGRPSEREWIAVPAVLGDRLREIRVEATARGLLTARQVIDIEREVCG